MTQTNKKTRRSTKKQEGQRKPNIMGRTIAIRLDEDLYQKIQEIAEKEERPAAWVIRRAISKNINRSNGGSTN